MYSFVLVDLNLKKKPSVYLSEIMHDFHSVLFFMVIELGIL